MLLTEFFAREDYSTANQVQVESADMSHVIQARQLAKQAISDQTKRQEYFDYMKYLRDKHGKDYSTQVHQAATSLDEHIVKHGSGYRLVSKKSGKNLGDFKTKAAAKKHEQEVAYFKHMGEDQWSKQGGEGNAWNNGENQWTSGSGQWSESVDNPEDTITVDVPLFIRLLEYAREDANTDMDLHQVAERITALSADGRTLSMNDYDAICGSKE